MQIIAHRGASWDAPENTLAAVQLAWDQGADAVEIDIQCSGDGRIVVLHDDNTKRTGGLHRKVARQTWAELSQLDVGSWKEPRWAGERIPSLAQVLDTVPRGKQLFVEFKCGPECIPEFVRVFQGSGRKPGQVIPIGFDLETMVLVKETLPKLRVMRVAKFTRSWKSGRWRPQASELIEQTLACRLDGLDLGANGPLTSARVDMVRRAGLRVYVWTVDDLARARRLSRAGIDGLTTNRPGWMRAHLNLTA